MEPPSSNLMASAMTKNRGDSKSNPMPAPRTSKVRWRAPVLCPTVEHSCATSGSSDTGNVGCPRRCFEVVLPENAGDGVDYVGSIFVRHAGRQRQRHHALVLPQSYREIFPFVPVLFAVILVQVDGDEVHGTANVATLHFGNELISGNSEAVQVESQNIEMPGVLNIFPLGGQLQFLVIAESSLIVLDNLAPPGVELGQLS